MPELPEVETIIRGLARHVVNRRIIAVDFRLPQTVVGDPDHTARKLAGKRIVALRRHGKYIIFELDPPDGGSCLVVHLRMTGNFIVNGEPGPHTRVIMDLEGGPTLVFHDIRKFGRWQLSQGLPQRLRELGPEPLEVSADEFTRLIRARRGILKALLLNQEFLRGLGNIYADEALFRARLHPKAEAAKVGPKRARRLHRAIQQVLADAIAQGGSSIDNFVDSDGSKGYFQLQVFVYGKAGRPCQRCEGIIRRIVVAGRGTHYCPKCQRR